MRFAGFVLLANVQQTPVSMDVRSVTAEPAKFEAEQLAKSTD